MATELGQAYVQIMPSAKGISGSIQKAINPEATAAGKSAGSRIASSIADSMGKAGKTLTKAITLPALGAATAVGGLVGALGFKRLVGLDSAQAKLKGLGYSGKEVERISGQVETAIAGGMTTMGEGVDVAAGALAAGVKEGAKLEKYIGLVGDAAVGANRPVDEMAQIFNRVQGGGRLMTQELNMIEMGLPGFAQKMADNLAGGSLDAFREMVTAGEVGSEDFLNVMEKHAGGMAAAYAESWAGMAKNTLAYVGIIGESLLEGLFEDGKKGLANLIEALQSEKLHQWATEKGEKIREVANTIRESVQSAIGWWTELDDSTKKLIGKIAGIAIIVGPILMIISKLTSLIITLIPAFKILGAAIALLTSPIGLVVAAIIAAAALIYIFWEPIKEFFIDLWESIKDITINVWNAIMDYLEPAISAIVDFVMDIWGALVDFWQEHGEMIMEAAMNVWNVIQTVITKTNEVIVAIVQWLADAIWEIMQFIWPFVELLIIDTWNAIKNTIQGVIDVVLGIVKLFASLFTGNWSELWESIKQILSGVVQALWGLINLWFVGKILKVGKTFFSLFKGVFRAGWNVIKTIFKSSLNFVRNLVSTVFNFIRSIISNVMNGIRSVITGVTGGIKNRFTSIFNGLKGIVSGAFNGVKTAVTNGMKNALSAVTNVVGKFKDAGVRIVTSIADGIKGAIGKVTGAISNVASKVRNFLPFSPPKEGPLMDIMDVKWGETIAGGIDKGENAVAKAMDGILDFDIAKTANFNDTSETAATRENASYKILLAILEEIRRLSEAGIEWNDRELARLVRKFV